jgi:aromatic ring-opening dioxygenase LigB subunit
MPDDNSIIKKVEDGIQEAAKAIEDFADKVAAPEEPVVIVPDDAPARKPASGKGG